MSKPDQAKGAKKSPTGNDGNLTAQHFAIGDKITTKSGKTGTVTHVHKKAGYLFIHNKEQGKTYHVSWGSECRRIEPSPFPARMVGSPSQRR